MAKYEIKSKQTLLMVFSSRKGSWAGNERETWETSEPFKILLFERRGGGGGMQGKKKYNVRFSNLLFKILNRQAYLEQETNHQTF